MKKLFYSFCLAMLMAFAGCSEAYDDQWILDKFEEMEKEHSDMQAQIDAQQTLLDALANKLTITAVTETENGYIVKFSDGSTATISDGKDGDSFIESIVVGEEDVTFTLADGTEIKIPRIYQRANEIWYTTTGVEAVIPYDASGFGASIVSNTYQNGKWVILFDGDVTAIGEDAFYGCSSLASITIPDSVTSIGDYAFCNCSSLASVTIGNGVTSIGDYAFRSCSSLVSITIPEGVTSIGGYAFSECTSLASITIPEGVTSIGEWAFGVCSSLASVIIPDGVTSIGMAAFGWCSSLASITIPDSVTSIGVGAFSGCSSLEEFSGNFASEDGRCLIVDGVLNSFAPAGLTEYTIPNNVTSIGMAAFYECSNLASITIPDSVTSIGVEAFYCCSSLASVTIGNGVTSIGDSAFERCSSLASVTIPDGVTSIGEGAFRYCSSLTSVTIPDSVTSIGWCAFEYCSSLASVYCKPITPPETPWGLLWTWSAFNENASGRKIYVPTESVEAYKTAEYWCDYADNIEGYDFE